MFADIHRIHVLKPIQYLRFSHTHRSGFPKVFRGGKIKFTDEGQEKRTTVECVLRDPAWLIEFTWKEVDGVAVRSPHQRRDRTLGMGGKVLGERRSVNFAKATAIFNRRLERGEYYYPPMLGLQGYRAIVHAPTGKEKPIAQSRDFGMVLHDFDYREKPPIPHVFHAKMVNGIVDVPSFYDTVLRSRKAA